MMRFIHKILDRVDARDLYELAVSIIIIKNDFFTKSIADLTVGI